MPHPPFVHHPATITAEFPALEAPARELGLLDEFTIDGTVALEALPACLVLVFPGAHFQLVALGSRSGMQQQGNWTEIRLPAAGKSVDSVDVLREFGCMVEAVTTRLLEGRRGTIAIPVLGRDQPLLFDRRKTPGYFLETAGFKFQDHSRAYVNRHAAALHSLAIALLTKTDPRLVFVDILEAATEDAQMLKLLSALAFRSNIDFRDRRELEDYATLYWGLQEGQASPYFNIHQVNEAASYYARQLRAHVRSLAV